MKKSDKTGQKLCDFNSHVEYKRNNKLIKQTKKFKVPSEYLQRGPTGFGVVFTIANIKYA